MGRTGKHRHNKLRVVIDTNVLLSKFISKDGTAGRAVDFIMRECRFLTCTEALAELAAKLALEKFHRYGGDEERDEFITTVEEQAELVTVFSDVQASIDPKDNIFLSLALDGRADYIVSGDKKHLQSLSPFEGIPILSPGDFLARMGR
jgi:putative PIN family toxin of toxin-antitoxin system